MSRYACHRLIAPLHRRKELPMQTMEIDDGGFFHSCVPMEKETAQTVWLGGICVLLPENIVPVCGETLRELSERAERNQESSLFCLWKIEGMPVDIPDTCPVYRWERVC